MALNLDYNHQTNITIPVVKRTLERYDWMRLHSFPLATHNANFDADFNIDLFSAKHNAQVLSLEHYLNGVLNPINPITIDNGIFNDETYIFIRGELFSEDTYLYTRAEAEPSHFIFTRTGLSDQGIDYIVNLSGTDSALETKLINYINEFNPAGKIYSINIY